MTAPAPPAPPGTIETRFRRARAEGRKLLVPYVTGGLGPNWVEVVAAVAGAGADAVEVGIPFSDPVIDGPVIQEASRRALASGATPGGILDGLATLPPGVPLVAMTYANVAYHAGLRAFARALAGAGVAGAILPDLPLDEAGDWMAATSGAGVEAILLAAPTTPEDRLARICAASRGWVYGVGVVGVTGERASVAGTVAAVAGRLKACTDLPVLVGLGISTPEQAAEVAALADGVIVGSALVRRLLEGAGPEGAAAFVAELRAGLDAGAPTAPARSSAG